MKMILDRLISKILVALRIRRKYSKISKLSRDELEDLIRKFVIADGRCIPDRHAPRYRFEFTDPVAIPAGLDFSRQLMTDALRIISTEISHVFRIRSSGELLELDFLNKLPVSAGTRRYRLMQADVIFCPTSLLRLVLLHLVHEHQLRHES